MRQTQRCIHRRNIGQLFSIGAAAEFCKFLAARTNHSFVTANGVVVGRVGAFEAGADFFKMFGELRDAGEKFFGRFGDFARVFRLRMLLPAHADGAENRDERAGRGDEDAFVLRPDH